MTALARRRGDYVPWLFAAGFAVVVLVNAVMIWLAVSSFSGLYSANARQHGLRYNDVIAEQVARDALGWTVAVTWMASAGRLQVDVRDAAGLPLTGARVSASLVRPVERRRPISVPMPPRDGGRYEAEVQLPVRGNWDVDVVVEHDGHRWASTRRMILQ
jgi:nitrogen fixation protein FixH